MREMQRRDWDAAPGRYLVLLAQPGQAAAAGEAALRRFAALASAFQRERRFVWRHAAVSPPLSRLLRASEGHETAADPGRPCVLVLHPKRERFLVVPLEGGEGEGEQRQAAAVARLEAVLDGDGRWRSCADAAG